jgi:hypothetical protein
MVKHKSATGRGRPHKGVPPDKPVIYRHKHKDTGRRLGLIGLGAVWGPQRRVCAGCKSPPHGKKVGASKTLCAVPY